LENKILWAPWRIKYIQELSDENDGCFFCRYLEQPDKDDENLVLWRTDKCVVVQNRFPYNNGHLLVAPKRHIADLEDADDEELLEMIKLVRECKKALTGALSPHGFNVGINLGRCAGAGLPGHMHIHIVPRWSGDTNFMSVCSETDVVSQSLGELLEQLKKTSLDNNLPNL